MYNFFLSKSLPWSCNEASFIILVKCMPSCLLIHFYYGITPLISTALADEPTPLQQNTGCVWPLKCTLKGKSMELFYSMSVQLLLSFDNNSPKA